jgi:hypothetical protein
VDLARGIFPTVVVVTSGGAEHAPEGDVRGAYEAIVARDAAEASGGAS